LGEVTYLFRFHMLHFGSGGKNYLETSKFETLKIEFQLWTNPKNDCGLDFRDYSFLDYFARFGKEKLKDFLMNHHKFE
jgi:hypothetical protein